VLKDCNRDTRVYALYARVLTAHNSLQFREFVNHL
jgi:hypothetical protein